MRSDDLRALQAPLKQRYRDAPEAAVITLKAKGELGDEGLTCKVETGRALVEATVSDATGIMTRETTGSGGSAQHYSIGSSILRGRVVDSKGQPVEGAALLIDSVPVFTDSDGRFFLRERRPHTHKLQVLPDKFLNGGSYEVESAPPTVNTTKDAGPETLIIVKRVAGINAGRSEL